MKDSVIDAHGIKVNVDPRRLLRRAIRAVLACVPAFAWYLFTFVFALAFPLVGYRLDRVDLDAPLSHEADYVQNNDNLLILPMIQATLEGGTHWRTDRLGYPGTQTLYDFPVIDHFHFYCLQFIGRFTNEAVVIFNIYYLLTYPLAAIVMLAVLRRNGISYPAAAAMGILYAALPYHQYRSQNHYFLSAYYMVPLTGHYIVGLCLGRWPFVRKTDAGYRFSLRNWSSLGAVVAMVITATSGAYYAFFACALLVAAGLYAWGHLGSWRGMASAGLLTGIVVAGGVASHLPTFRHQAEFGKHSTPVSRVPDEADMYGLKLSLLLLPIDDHRVREFAEFKSIYNCPNRQGQAYTERHSIGLVAAASLLGLMIVLFFPKSTAEPYRSLATLAFVGLVIGIGGGLGSIFNQLITPSVRCYNRIAVYIAFFCFFALAQAGDRGAAWLVPRLPRMLGWILPVLLWTGVVAFALWDMTPFHWATPQRVKSIEANQKRWKVDREYFRSIEDLLNPERVIPGPAVFQLPYVAWPESAPQYQLASYDHARGYLHTQTLRFSFGCMKGRETDEWMRSVFELSNGAVQEMLNRLVLAGFEGLILDKRGYSPGVGLNLEKEIRKWIPEATTLRHPDGQQIFFDLRPYRTLARQGRSDADWERVCHAETHRCCALWLDGFFSYAEPGYDARKRVCGLKGEVIFVNPCDEPRTITIKFRLTTDLREPPELTIAGGSLWSESFAVPKSSPVITRTLLLPPGRHVVHFLSVPSESHMPNEHRRVTFAIEDFKLE